MYYTKRMCSEMSRLLLRRVTAAWAAAAAAQRGARERIQSQYLLRQ